MVAAPTPYSAVNEVLAALHTQVKAVLGSQFVGLYLYGSLATGDFNLESSDLDFLVVTEDLLPSETIAALETLHQELWAGGLKWAAKLEGSYVPRALIRRHDPEGPACPTVNEGAFFIDRRGSDWILQRHVIRECGLVLDGPDPKTLIDPVSAEEIRGAVLGVLAEWWFPMLDQPAWLSERGSEYHAYAVISLCRALHALRHGTIVSKPAAARWAQAEYQQWQPLIEQALLSQAGSQPGFLEAALDFLRFTREQITGLQELP
jgi:predicted nucleotidyltransferase